LYLEEGVLRLMDEQAGRHPPIKPEERRGRPEAVHSQNLKKGYQKITAYFLMKRSRPIVQIGYLACYNK
jgi:hypothetical protein